MSLASTFVPLGGGTPVPIPATQGGTGLTTFVVGDMLYANSTTTLTRLAASTSGYVLTAQGAGVAPIWAPVAGAGLGDFSGPASSTDNEIVRFDGTSGKTGQTSGITIGDVAATNITVRPIASNDLTLAGGNSGASLVLGNGATAAATLNKTVMVSLGLENFPTSGEGINIHYDSTNDIGYVQAYDFTGAAWKPLRIKGSQIEWSSNGSERSRLTSTGNLLIGGTTDISGSGGLKVFGTTAATSTTSGAFQCAGGAGIAGAIYVGGSTLLNGEVTIRSTTATPAGGSTSARLLFGTTSGFGIYYGSGAPTVSAAQGSIYLRSDGAGTSSRFYVNTDGATTWTPVITTT